ncbi:MAG: hypothetical protein ACOH14_06440 [Rhodoglobus sp.]
MAATKKPAPTPGPKPDFLVVENHLKCQTDEGEKSIDLRISFDRIELLMDMDEGTIEDKKMPRYVLDNILWPEDKAKLLEMRDGAKVVEIIMKVAEEIGARMGANMGESLGSHEQSEPTDQPSDSTSDATSDSP